MTLILFSPDCVGCMHKEETDLIREFAKSNNHTFATRDTRLDVNKSVLIKLGLKKYVGLSFILCLETSRFHIISKSNLLTRSELEKLTNRS